MRNAFVAASRLAAFPYCGPSLPCYSKKSRPQNHGASRGAWEMANAKALMPLSVGTAGEPSLSAFKWRGPDKRADPSPKSPVPYLEVRDRPVVPPIGGLAFL